MLFKGRHAVVTGGATGIGMAITRALIHEGARVTIMSRNTARLEAFAETIDHVTPYTLDVTDAESVKAAFKKLGPVDILVNNAGAATTAPFHRTTLEDWNTMLSVNLTGTFLMTQGALESMRATGQGRIINIASTSGLKGYAYTAAYTAAKHGVVGMTRALALELASTEITANCICPGFTDTSIVSDAVENITRMTGHTKEEALSEITRHNPQGRLITPEEVAETAVWLCRDSSRSINGQSIIVAGGEIP